MQRKILKTVRKKQNTYKGSMCVCVCVLVFQ